MSRLTYGSRFSSSTPLTRHAVNHGTIFPLSPSEAELFYKTDTRVLYIYDEGWKSFGMGTGGGDTGGQLPPWINTEQGTIRMSRFHDDLGLYGTCRKIISGSSLPYTETSERSDLFFLHAEGEGDGRPYFFDGTVWVEMGTKLPQWLVVGESNAQSDVMLSGFGDDIGVHTCERFRRTASSVFPPSEESNTGDVLYRDDVKGAYVFDGNTWVSLSASVPPWVLLDQGSVPLSSFDQDIDLNLAHRVRVLNHVPSSGTSTQGDIILHAGNGHDASLRVFDGNEFVPVSPPPWSSENMKNIQALGFDTQGLVLHSEVSPIATTEQSKVPISGFLDDFGLGISREALAVDALPIPVVSLEGSLRYDRTSRRLYACDGSRWIPSSGPDPPPWSMRGQDQIFLSGFADDVGIGMGHSLRLHELTEFPLPGEAARGDVMFKTDVKTAYVYTGNEWAPMSGAGGGLPSWVSRLQGSVALSGFYDDIGIGVSKYVRAKNYLPPNEHAGEILYHTGARALLVSDGNAWEYVTPPWITTDPVDILVLGTFDTTGLIKEGDLPIWIKNDQGLIPISAFSDDVGLSTASKVRSVDTSKVQLPPSSANREIGEILYDTVSGAIMVYDKRGVWSPQRPAWVKDEPGSIRIGTFTNDVGYLTSSSIPDWVLGSETQNDLRLSGFIDDLAPGRGIRVAATLPSNHEEGDIVYSSGSVYFSKGSSWAALRPSWVSDQSSGVPVGDFYNDVGYVKAGDLPSWFAQDSRDVTLSSFRNDLDITISIGVRDYTTLPASGESNAVPGHLVTKQGTVYAYDGSRWVPQRPGWVIESPSDISLSVFKNDVGFVRSINLPVWASTMQQSLVPLSGFLDDVDIKYATNIKQVSSVESLRGRGGAQGGEVSYSLAERDLYYYREGGNGVGSGWRAIRPNWVLDSQNDILVSKFINDVGYITETEPARKLSLSQPIVSSSNDVGAVYYHGRSTGAQQASSIRVWDGTRWLVTFASATEIMKMTSSWIPGVNSNPSQLVGSARFQRLSPDIELEFGSYVGIGFDVVNGHASNIRTIFVAPTNAMAPQMPTDNDTDVEIVWPVFVQGVYGGATLAVLAVPWIGGDLAVFAQAIAAENVGSLSSDAILTHEPPPSCDEQNQNQASPLGFAEFGVRVEIIHGDFSVEGSIMGANVLGVEPVSPPASLVMFKLPVDGRLCVDSVERVPVAYPARAVEGRLQVHDHVGTAVYGLAYGNVIGKDVAAYAPVLTPGGGRMFDVHVSRQVNLLEPGWSVVEHTVVRRDTARTCIVIALVTPDSLPVFDPANSSLPGPQYARSLPSGYDGSADVTNSHARSLGHVQWSDEDGAYVSSDVEERGALYPKLIACRVDCCESGEGYPARAVAWEYIGEPWSNIGKMLHGWEWSGGSRGTDLLYKVFERTWIWIKYGSSGIYDEFVADGKLLTWFKSHIIGNASRLGQEQMSLVHSRVHPNTRDKGFDQGYAYHNSIFTLVTHTIINGGAMLALHDALHSTENYLRSESALRATRTVDGWLLPGPNCFRCNKLTYAEHIADEGGGSSEDYYLLNPAKASVTPNASASGGGVTNGFTISIWLKIEEYIEPAYVLSMRGDNTGTGSNDYCSISVLPRPGGERTVVKVKFGFVGNDFWHGATVNDGEFHHVYVEYLNDSNYGDRILIAVDGVIETYDIGWRQLVSVAETSVDVSRPTGMRIGRSWDETTPSTFIGLVDELAIWTGRALWLGGGGLGLEGGVTTNVVTLVYNGALLTAVERPDVWYDFNSLGSNDVIEPAIGDAKLTVASLTTDTIVDLSPFHSEFITLSSTPEDRFQYHGDPVYWSVESRNLRAPLVFRWFVLGVEKKTDVTIGLTSTFDVVAGDGWVKGSDIRVRVEDASGSGYDRFLHGDTRVFSAITPSPAPTRNSASLHNPNFGLSPMTVNGLRDESSSKEVHMWLFMPSTMNAHDIEGSFKGFPLVTVGPYTVYVLSGGMTPHADAYSGSASVLGFVSNNSSQNVSFNSFLSPVGTPGELATGVGFPASVAVGLPSWKVLNDDRWHLISVLFPGRAIYGEATTPAVTVRVDAEDPYYVNAVDVVSPRSLGNPPLYGANAESWFDTAEGAYFNFGPIPATAGVHVFFGSTFVSHERCYSKTAMSMYANGPFGPVDPLGVGGVIITLPLGDGPSMNSAGFVDDSLEVSLRGPLDASDAITATLLSPARLFQSDGYLVPSLGATIEVGGYGEVTVNADARYLQGGVRIFVLLTDREQVIPGGASLGAYLDRWSGLLDALESHATPLIAAHKDIGGETLNYSETLDTWVVGGSERWSLATSVALDVATIPRLGVALYAMVVAVPVPVVLGESDKKPPRPSALAQQKLWLPSDPALVGAGLGPPQDTVQAPGLSLDTRIYNYFMRAGRSLDPGSHVPPLHSFDPLTEDRTVAMWVKANPMVSVGAVAYSARQSGTGDGVIELQRTTAPSESGFYASTNLSLYQDTVYTFDVSDASLAGSRMVISSSQAGVELSQYASTGAGVMTFRSSGSSTSPAASDAHGIDAQYLEWHPGGGDTPASPGSVFYVGMPGGSIKIIVTVLAGKDTSEVEQVLFQLGPLVLTVRGSFAKMGDDPATPWVPATIADGVWHSVVVAWSHAQGSAGTSTLFVDGAEVAGGSVQGARLRVYEAAAIASAPHADHVDLQKGLPGFHIAWYGPPYRPFNPKEQASRLAGLVTDVGVFSMAFVAGDAVEMYNNGYRMNPSMHSRAIGGGGSTLLAAWRFREANNTGAGVMGAVEGLSVSGYDGYDLEPFLIQDYSVPAKTSVLAGDAEGVPADPPTVARVPYQNAVLVTPSSEPDWASARGSDSSGTVVYKTYIACFVPAPEGSPPTTVAGFIDTLESDPTGFICWPASDPPAPTQISRFFSTHGTGVVSQAMGVLDGADGDKIIVALRAVSALSASPGFGVETLGVVSSYDPPKILVGTTSATVESDSSVTVSFNAYDAQTIFNLYSFIVPAGSSIAVARDTAVDAGGANNSAIKYYTGGTNEETATFRFKEFLDVTNGGVGVRLIPGDAYDVYAYAEDAYGDRNDHAVIITDVVSEFMYLQNTASSELRGGTFGEASIPESGSVFTLSIWFKYGPPSEVNGDPAAGTLVCLTDGAGGRVGEITVEAAEESVLTMLLGSYTPPSYQIAPGYDYRVGWHNLVWVQNGSEAIVYLQGEEVSRVTWPAPLPAGYTTLVIGGNGGTGSQRNWFKGLVGDVVMYSGVRSPLDIRYMFNGGLATVTPYDASSN